MNKIGYIILLIGISVIFFEVIGVYLLIKEKYLWPNEKKNFKKTKLSYSFYLIKGINNILLFSFGIIHFLNRYAGWNFKYSDLTYKGLAVTLALMVIINWSSRFYFNKKYIIKYDDKKSLEEINENNNI